MNFGVIAAAGSVAAVCALVIYFERRAIFGSRAPLKVARAESATLPQATLVARPATPAQESVQPRPVAAKQPPPSVSAPPLSSARRTRMYTRRAPPRRPATLRQSTTSSPKQDEPKPEQ